MNNEETIVMKPQSNDNKAELTKNVETTEKKSNIGKKAVAAAAASMIGGVVGGATYAATDMLYDKETEEQKPKEEAQATEENIVAATTEEPKKEEYNGAHKEEVTAKVDDDANTEPDYTNNNGADPVTPNPEVHATVDETDNGNVNEVQVLGVYEAQGENGQTMQAAVLTNGEEVAAVVDIDGDGVADALLVDENHNQQIDEGEVYDLSNNHVQMSDYQDSYMAQQQMQQEQQEHDTFAYNANDDQQQDFNNDADLQYL